MEKEILEILKAMQQDIKGLKDGQEKIVKRLDNLEEGQKEIEKKLDGIIEQTADLTEFRTETKNGIEAVQRDINKLTNVTKVNCFEIADLKAVK